MNSVLKLGKVGGGAILHENWDDPVEGQFAFQIRVDPWDPTRFQWVRLPSISIQNCSHHACMEIHDRDQFLMKIGKGRGGAI